MHEIVWPATVIDQIAAIAAYIAPHDPAASRRMEERLFRAGESLAHFPNRGRPRPDGTRELAIVPPYIIRYAVEDEQVLILSIRHGARNPD